RFLKLWKPIYGLFSSRFTFNGLYNNLLASSVSKSNIVTNRYMNGLLRHYLIYIFVFFIVTVGGYLFYSKAFSFDVSTNASFRVYEVCLVTIMSIAALFMLFAKSRMTATLLNGVLGYSIAIFFVIFRAPD